MVYRWNEAVYLLWKWNHFYALTPLLNTDLLCISDLLRLRAAVVLPVSPWRWHKVGVLFRTLGGDWAIVMSLVFPNVFTMMGPKKRLHGPGSNLLWLYSLEISSLRLLFFMCTDKLKTWSYFWGHSLFFILFSLLNAIWEALKFLKEVAGWWNCH